MHPEVPHPRTLLLRQDLLRYEKGKFHGKVAAANDWLNGNETDESAHKTRAWLNQPATAKQLRYLPAGCRHDFGLTRYQASALLTFQFNKAAITDLVTSVAELRRAA